MELNDEEALEFINRLLERMQRAGHANQGSKIELVYVAPGAQHVDHVENQNIRDQQPHPETHPHPLPTGRGVDTFKGEGNNTSLDAIAECLRHCITLLMQEKCGNEPLFNQQNHWQAVYRILVDKGYCRDSDFDGFDTFIRTVMPEEVNKPYSKGSLKQISQTDFVRPFTEWRYDVLTSKTRKPYDRMVAVARRFLEILEENGL